MAESLTLVDFQQNLSSYQLLFFCDGQNVSILEFLTRLLVLVKSDDGY